MDQIPAAMDRHLDVIRCHSDNGGLLLGASSLTGRYWFGSLWYYDSLEAIPDVEKCSAGVQLEAGLSDARWVDSTKVIVALDTGGVALWDLTDNYHTFLLVHSAVEHDDMVNMVSVSADQTKVLSASNDHRIKVWDIDNLTSTHCYRGHSDNVNSVEFHPKENHIFLSTSYDGRVILWDTRKSKPASIVDKSPLDGMPTCVDWQHNVDNIVALGDELGKIVVKDIRMPTNSYKTVVPHNRSVYRIEFSHNKPNLFASIGEDCRTVISSIDNDQITSVYNQVKHTDFVHGLAWFNEDIVTCGWDSQVYRHSINNGHKTNHCDTETIGDSTNILVNNTADVPHKSDLIESIADKS